VVWGAFSTFHAGFAHGPREIASTALQWLFGINKSVLSELVGAGVIVRGEKRGTTASPTKNQTSLLFMDSVPP
jgi:hypothetical protein